MLTAQQLIRRHLTEVNWEKMDSHAEIVLDLFSQPGAKSLIRAGDGEMYILQDQDPIAPQLAEAIGHADCLGLLGMENSEWTKSTVFSLRKYHQVEIDKSVHVSACIFQFVPELLGKIAKGKRVLWITEHADIIVENLATPAFRNFYGLHGLVSNDYLNAAEAMGGDVAKKGALPKNISAEQAVEDIRQQLEFSSKNFDLAFVGVGVAGKPICHHIKTVLEKSAIDIGVLMSCLRGSRERPQLRPNGGTRFPLDFVVWDPD